MPFFRAMDAATYIRGYYDEEDLEKEKINVKDLLEEINRFAVINADWLNELWPNCEFRDIPLGIESLLPDLSNLTLDNSFYKYDMSKFIQDPSLLSTDEGWELFMKLAVYSSEIDLTPFQNLEVDKILTIIEVAVSGRPEKKLTFWLPNHDELRLEDIHSIVDTNAISGLHVGTVSKVTLGEMLTCKALFGTSGPDDFTHPWRYARAAQLTGAHGLEFAERQLAYTDKFICGPGTRFPLRQVVYLTSVRKPDAARLDSGGLRWKEQVGNSHYAILLLQDALLSFKDLPKLIPSGPFEAGNRTGVAARGQICLQGHLWHLEDAGRSCKSYKVRLQAQSLTLVQDDHRISPLPGLMDSACTMMLGSDNTPPSMFHKPEVLPGDWTLLVVRERPESSDGSATIRYAFVYDKKPGLEPAPEHLQALIRQKFAVLNFSTLLSKFAKDEELETLRQCWFRSLDRLRDSMTSLKRALETHAVTEAEIAAVREHGDDALNPHPCKDVSFGVMAHEEFMEALKAVDKLKDKAPSDAQVPAASSSVRRFDG